MSSGGVLRVGIPASLRKTIQDIKEIAGKHSDDDIYAMLKECNMDPNETAQKLLYLDTFHEVKRKRDKKKLTVSNQVAERNRWAPGMQRRGARGGRGNNSSGYSSNDTGGGQRIGPPKENGSTVQSPTSAAGLAVPVHHNTKSDAVYETISSNDRPTNLVSGSSMHESARHSEGNVFKSGQGTSAADVAVDVNQSGTRPPPPNVAVKPLKDLNPGPTPAPTPTTTFNTETEAGYEGKKSESSSDKLSSKPVSGVYSSASDPVLLPSLNPRNPGAVGTIKRETGIQKIAPEHSDTSLSEIRLNVNQDGGKADQVDPRTMESNRKIFPIVEKDQPSEPSKPAPLLSHDNTTTTVPQDGWSSKQANGSSNVMTHMGASVSPRANTSSLPKVDDSVLGKATSQLNRKLEDLNITSQKPVIFPDHVQVPEAFRNGLTFGSLDGSFGQEIASIEDAKLVDSTTLATEDGASEPSLSHEIASATAREGEYPTHLQSFPCMPANLPVLEVDAPPTAPPLSESSKPEIIPPVGGLPYSFLPTAPEYGFSMMPPMLAPHLVHVEETEVSNSSVSSASVSSQPSQQTTVGVGQTSTAVSPPLFPYLRQPYPSNYFPYNPYFPHLYMPPPNAPQYFGHTGFAQQPSTGNMYMPPPPAAGTGVKFPVPQIYKPGTVAANLTHFGIPSGYGSYGTSMLGYGIAATMTPPGSSSSTEDLTAPELKEKNVYPVLKQNEEAHVWTSASARDLQNLQANFFYNFPHGQQVTYSPAPSGQQGSIAGMYHLTAPTTAAAPPPPPPSIAQSLPQHSQVMIGSVETPAGTYQQQPHSRAGWNPKFLNRENI